jgi:regulator of sigma E protease
LSIVAIIAFVLVFGLVVLVHELGHFLAARKFGVGVDEFGLGLPPRIWGKKVGKTIYSINWIPFGGFVRLEGESGEDVEDSARSLRHKGFWQRLMVIVAGVVMNFLLAYVLTCVGFWMGMPPIAVQPTKLVSDVSQIESKAVVTGLDENLPASSAGIEPGDIVLQVNDVVIVSAEQLSETIAATTKRTLSMRLLRDTEELNLTVETASSEGRRVIGVYTSDLVQKVSYVWWQVPYLAGRDFVVTVGYIGDGIKDFFVGLFTTGKVSEDVTGPLGIAEITGQVVKLGFLTIVQFVAMLSINLGIVNILPIPALDGGRLMMLLIESVVSKKRWNYKIEAGVHSLGFVLLLALIILVTYRDIVRIF